MKTNELEKRIEAIEKQLSQYQILVPKSGPVVLSEALQAELDKIKAELSKPDEPRLLRSTLPALHRPL